MSKALMDRQGSVNPQDYVKAVSGEERAQGDIGEVARGQFTGASS